MTRKPFLAATGQMPFVYGVMALTIIGALSLWLVQRQPLRGTVVFWELISGVALTIVPFFAACFFVRCPNCKTRLVWHGATKRRVKFWLGELLLMTECPICHHVPK